LPEVLVLPQKTGWSSEIARITTGKLQASQWYEIGFDKGESLVLPQRNARSSEALTFMEIYYSNVLDVILQDQHPTA
jgi:hypothetical protein